MKRAIKDRIKLLLCEPHINRRCKYKPKSAPKLNPFTVGQHVLMPKVDRTPGTVREVWSDHCRVDWDDKIQSDTYWWDLILAPDEIRAAMKEQKNAGL